MRVEHEYERGGALQYLAAWDVRRGRVLGRCEDKTGIDSFARLVDQVMRSEPYRSASRVFWVVDNGSSHRGQAAIRRLRKAYRKAVLVHTPVHASWLNQVEIYFSIDRKIDLHLVEPTGMHGSMNQDCLAVSLSQSPDRCLTAVRGAVVNDPENTAGRSIWLTPHHLIDQSGERVDSGLILASTKDSTAANVPGSQVLQCAAPLILMFHSHGASRTRRQSRVTSDSGLDARLLVRADDVVPTAQRFTLPGASVQVQNAPSFFGELRVAWKDPVLIPPGFNRVVVQDSPDSAWADR